ncbi:hypothetical protein CC78DRAFT_201323 [Lojkania enalia]|uniref:Uncharacterized protein n=1 Tax=Lojkania enalia TaxID=147567 RepID=A0A9P4KC07_9PLEO|nr:hypothetical protein CC78DRAFT_201323 [Didymosphaeria enalia]
MDSSVLFRQLLRTPSPYRTFVQASIRPQTRTFALLASGAPPRFLSTNSLPRIVQPSFWASLIPKPFRSSPTTPPSPSLAAPKSQEWNPATPYIILGLLVGSQAIQILWLKRDHAHFMWRAEAKIGALREVVERVQRGEDVDVEAVLGKEGNEEEWKEGMCKLHGLSMEGYCA